MADAMAIDEVGRGSSGFGPRAPLKKTLKRKRAGVVGCTGVEEREVMVKGLKEEMEGLLRYYKEALETKVEGMELDKCETSNAMIACLLEESELPLSKLVECVFEKLKGRKEVSVTMASVKSSVVLLGQRMAYGVLDEDADVLEDDMASCLWCWETRDLKMLPKSARVMLKIRRICRNKIHERITAVSGFLSSLRNPGSDSCSKSDSRKRSEKLCKVLNEADIRLLMDSMIQKNGTDLSLKEGIKEEKLIVKQLEKNKRELEREKKRMDRETQKEKLLHDKEKKRLQEETEMCREKEKTEIKKQQKRLQDEAEKEKRRREKDDAELKKQLALKKQASLMDRFLKKRKTDCSNQNVKPSTDATNVSSFVRSSQLALESVILSIDNALAQCIEVSTSGLQKSHMESWHILGQYIRSNRKQHWGLRHKPKTELIKEIKLSSCKDIACDNDLNDVKILISFEDSRFDKSENTVEADESARDNQKSGQRKQLLQFDKSFRPAFYGIWPKKSNIVGPRRPFKKDPDLDYDVDSDEEWEEEDPGESLSDCDKDEEYESLEDGNEKAEEEDESVDGFFVPDGYLSDDEGAQNKSESNLAEDMVSSSNQVEENEEIQVLLRHHRHFQKLIEQALRKNQPLFISNLVHETAPLLKADNPSGIPKNEQICLQALSMCLFPGHPQIEISEGNEIQNGNTESCTPNSKANTTVKVTKAAAIDLDLPTFVTAIQCGSQGMAKIFEGLQQNFPGVPKSLLKAKVRQLSNFIDNRWQVKKEVLDALGLPPSPAEKVSVEKPPADKGTNKKMRSIASFFLKRCLPPSDITTINPNEVSPQAPKKIAGSADLEPLLGQLCTTKEPKTC
ncbi:unnamed protein product [Rhodiola kirilowii]